MFAILLSFTTTYKLVNIIMDEFPRFGKKDRKPPMNEKAKEETESISGHHSEDLYDQNEDTAGEKTNLANGKPFDNTRDKGNDEQLRVIEPGDKDALPPLEEEDDAAAKWLREHGG